LYFCIEAQYDENLTKGGNKRQNQRLGFADYKLIFNLIRRFKMKKILVLGMAALFGMVLFFGLIAENYEL